jgi:hypothetical protein
MRKVRRAFTIFAIIKTVSGDIFLWVSFLSAVNVSLGLNGEKERLQELHRYAPNKAFVAAKKGHVGGETRKHTMLEKHL